MKLGLTIGAYRARRVSRHITAQTVSNTHATYFHHFLYRLGRLQEKQALF
jgi:hypothetical protein